MKIKGELPINKTAALVTQKAGQDWVFDAKGDVNYRMNDDFWKSPKPTIKFAGLKEHDLTGKKHFRAQVIGFIGNKRWQLKCCCGNYYQRKHEKLKTGRVISWVCGECYRKYDMMRHNDYLKNGCNKRDIDWYLINR